MDDWGTQSVALKRWCSIGGVGLPRADWVAFNSSEAETTPEVCQTAVFKTI
ncbi:MAG: hypothetical protein AAF703_04290 [Cyanobacteria bacterium P01_D01_bin.105]